MSLLVQAISYSATFILELIKTKCNSVQELVKLKKQRNFSDSFWGVEDVKDVPEHHSTFIEVKAGVNEKLPVVVIVLVVVAAVSDLQKQHS